jgi:hypothetical protein
VAVADLNGDCYDDLAIASDTRRTAPTIDIWYGGPEFTFERNNYAQRFTFAISSPCLDFTLVDFNADGRADLSYSDGYRTYFHFGTEGLLHPSPDSMVTPDSTFYLYNPRGGAMRVGDLNGDGKEDFVIRQAPGNYAFMCLHVYLGNQSPSPRYVSGRCKSSVDEFTAFREVVPVGDINGDGVNDFAGAIPYDNQVQYLQDGYFAIFSGDTRWVTDVKSAGEPCPCEFELSRNYPNPFNPSTTVKVRLPRSGHVTITVFDMLGREVARLVDADAEAGDYAYTWDGRNFKDEAVASGSYLCTLRFNDMMIKSIKLLVVR